MAPFLLYVFTYYTFSYLRRFTMILEVLFRFMTAGVIGSSISTAVYFMVV